MRAPTIIRCSSGLDIGEIARPTGRAVGGGSPHRKDVYFHSHTLRGTEMQITPIKSKEEFEQIRRSLDTQLAEVLASRPDLSYAKIGNEFGISEKVIRRVMKQFSIGARKRGPKRTQQVTNAECFNQG
jgi:hypothetical protein